MNGSSKLQPDFSTTGIGQPIVVLVIFAMIWGIYGITAALAGIAAVYGLYAIMSMAYTLRTGNPWFLVPFVFQVTVIFFALLAPGIGLYAIPRSSFQPIVLILIVEMAVLIYIIRTKKLKWRGREILELAAMHVDDTSNGFTERPRPLGKIEYSHAEIAGFAGFLKSRLIAWPVVESNRIVLVPIATGNEYRLPLGFSGTYAESTWVAIDRDGNVQAQISKKDYLKYKDTLAFDQLVESLGQVFIEFLEKYRKGEEQRIIYELNNLKVHPFS
jgi:hypothetical protein